METNLKKQKKKRKRNPYDKCRADNCLIYRHFKKVKTKTMLKLFRTLSSKRR